MLKKKGKKVQPEINAGSMADIAFLLLIFFLVTTTVEQDKGLLVPLAPWSDEVPPTINMKKRNILSILVNAQNQLLVRGEPADIKDLRERTKEFITNPGHKEDLAESPSKAIVSIKNDRGTEYDTYLNVYNELLAAYRELWDGIATTKFKKNYELLNDDQKKEVRADIPLILSEAESTSFGEEK